MESPETGDWFCEYCENNHEIYEEPAKTKEVQKTKEPSEETPCLHSKEAVCERCLEKVCCSEKVCGRCLLKERETTTKDPRPKGQNLSDKKFYLFLNFSLLAASAYALWHGTKYHLSVINDSANSIIKTLSRPTL